ncbi:MAG TPA: transporter, partial [Panacibacter sp.]|nr:transporter [Panacibacter sp.]
MKKAIDQIIILFAVLSILTGTASAQGDGARMLLWGPKGVTGVIPKWMHLNQNMVPGNILVKDADVTINVFPVTIIHNFGIGKNFAQIMVNAVPGSVKGRVTADLPGNPSPSLSSNGFADGFVGFKLGLVNQPALNVMEYAKYKHKTFSMMSYFRLWYPGSYNRSSALNLGTNRVSFDLG